MAHVQDRWETVIDGQRVRTDCYGSGKRWKARYQDPDGIERSRMFERKQDGERFLTTIAADVLRGFYIDPNAGRITFADFADQWLTAQTFTETTREATERRLRLHATPMLGDHELRNLKPSIIQAWLRGLQTKIAPSYVRTVLTNTSAVLNAAVDDGLIPANPFKAKSVRPPKVDRDKIEPWPIAQVESVIEQLPDRYRALAVVGAGCGLRQGEIFGLRVQDIEYLRRRIQVQQQVKLVHGRLTIDKPKNRRTRTVPLPDWVAVELTEHLRRWPAGDDGLVFTSREHKPLHRSYVNAYIWKPALRAVGVDTDRRNGMHALRHFYASVLIDAGQSAAAEYLGHADPGFTLRVYAHLFPSSEDRARRAIDGRLGTGSSTATGTTPSY